MDFLKGSNNGALKPEDVSKKKESTKGLAMLSMAALGVVFGDIGTSPLYAIRECFHGDYAIPVSQENILGVLSLMFWSLVMIVTIKYLTFVLRADNKGEGGVLVLATLVKKTSFKKSKGLSLVAIGVFGACLLYGDGMITPSISVLSAIEGLKIVTPVFTPFVVPITVGILAGLFMIQRRGTASVGGLFGPIIFIWFAVLAILGISQISKDPQILYAILPWHAINFLIVNKGHGLIVLGAVFLAVTGAEALYADMGHFGKKPIRITWLALVFPALILNYLGQGSLLLMHPELSFHPFYGLVPDWGLIPLVILATMATIIASQAVITGAFSLTQQAIQFGYFPRLKVSHTSATQIGQIYIAPVNWLLAVCTIALVLGFRSSSQLAAAYGVAVTATMLITDTIFYVVARQRWHWSKLLAGSLAGIFILIDIPFFMANITKLFHGAWFPLFIAGIVFTIMLTWKEGRRILGNQIMDLSPTINSFQKMLTENPPQKVPGTAIYLTGNPNRIPQAMIQNLTHNKIVHSEIILLHFQTEDVPRVPNFEKVEVEKVMSGFHIVNVRHGFMETPKIDTVLSLAREKGIEIDMETTSFFLGREKLLMSDHPKMAKWRTNLFLFLSKNSRDASTYFGIPPNQVIEVGHQFEL
jgi:KUP system potassium uptake protein